MPDVFENLDPSTLKAKFESARKSAEATPKDSKLESQVQAALRAEIKRIQDYAEANPDDELAKANQHLRLKGGAIRADVAEKSWLCGGTVNLAGGAWWVLGGSVMFPPPYGFLFGSKGGPDLVLGGFESSIVGSFVTDPAIIIKDMRAEDVPVIGRVYKGRGRFQLGALTGAAGAVRISFYSLTGTYWGMLGGVAVGVAGVSLTDECDLVWSG
jgi:hypothetical protein